jgi:hypothetical protein
LSFLFDVVVTRLFLPVFAKFSWTFFHSYIFLLLLSLKKKVYTFHPPPTYTFLLTCTYTAITRVYLCHLRPQRALLSSPNTWH